MALAELQEIRENVQGIDTRALSELSPEERLARSLRVIPEGLGGAAVTLRALDPEDVTIGHGKRTGWCKVCAMQLVEMRTNGNLVIGPDVRLRDQPDYVAPWVGDLVIRLNDGMPDTPEGNNWRKELFLPFIDQIAMAGKNSPEAARAAGFYMADWVSRSLLPELLEHPYVDLPERASVHRQLEPVVDTETANASQDAAWASRHAAWASRHATNASQDAAWASRHAANASQNAAWASRHATNASQDAAWASRYAAEASQNAAWASRYAAEVLGWPRVSELARRLLLPGVIARSVNTEDHARLAIARTNKDVARALDEMAPAA